jgi:hypothetical protein
MKDFQTLVMMLIVMVLVVEVSQQLRWFRKLLDSVKTRTPSTKIRRAIRGPRQPAPESEVSRNS